MLKDFLESIYYIAFIALTWSINKTALLTYLDQRKRPGKVLVRVNYNYDHISYTLERRVPVTADLYNEGDSPMKNLEIIFLIDNETIVSKEVIPYIAPNETYKHALGWIDGKMVHWSNEKMTSLYLQMDYEYIWNSERSLSIVCVTNHKKNDVPA